MCPEEIYAAYGLTCPPRYATLRDPGWPTYGRAVARVAARLGMPMMPHQRLIADTALEANQNGSLRRRKINILLPRQHGKTTLVLSVGVWRMTEFCHVAARLRPWQGTRQKSLYAAQKLIDSREKFVDDHWPVLDSSLYKSRYRKRQKNGAEALLWSTGGIQAITAAGETSAHGKVLDQAFEDEAFAAIDNRLEAAFSPAMATRESPQHWVLSTEGTEKSLYLAEIVEAGRAVALSGEDSTICYIEFSGDPEADRSQLKTQLAAMPALCPTQGPCECKTAWGWRHTITQEHVHSELEAMTAKGKGSEFDRAYLNIRRRSTPPPDPNMPTIEQLRACIEVRSRPGETVAMAVDISPKRSHAAIGLASWTEAGGYHIEVIDARSGVDWLVPRIQALHERWGPLAWGLDAKGQAVSLLVPLEEKKIVKPESGKDPVAGQLWIPSSQDVAASCGRLVDGIRAKTVKILDCPVLQGAWMVARTRPLGDAWAWGRRQADGDISPLVAVTLAVGALEARKGVAGEVDVLASLGLEDDGQRVEGDDEWI